MDPGHKARDDNVERGALMLAPSRLGLDADTHRAAQPRAAQTTVAVRHLGQVLLVVVLGEIELRRVDNLGGDGAVAVGREHLLVGRLGGLRGAALGRRSNINAGAILRAYVVALAHALRGIVALPEGL